MAQIYKIKFVAYVLGEEKPRFCEKQLTFVPQAGTMIRGPLFGASYGDYTVSHILYDMIDDCFLCHLR